VVLFGSRARGGYKPHSNIDVAVIAENLPGDRSIPWLGGVEPRGYTSDEFVEALVEARHDGPGRMQRGDAGHRPQLLKQVR